MQQEEGGMMEKEAETESGSLVDPYGPVSDLHCRATGSELSSQVFLFFERPPETATHHFPRL